MVHEPLPAKPVALKPSAGKGKVVVGFLVLNLGLCVLCDTDHLRLGWGMVFAGVAWFLLGHIENFFRVRAFEARQVKEGVSKSSIMKPTVSAALLMLALSCGVLHSAWAAALSPTQQIQDIDNLLKGWHKGKKLSAEETKENADIKKRVITQDFDLNELSRLALGGQWAKLNDKQRRDFVETFTQLLLQNAILHSEKYNGDESIEYVSEKPVADNKSRMMVKSKITVPEESVDFDVSYAMIFDKAKNRWRVYDLILDEESLMQNYHDQFQAIIAKHGYDSLVQKMKKKLGDDKSGKASAKSSKAAKAK